MNYKRIVEGVAVAVAIAVAEAEAMAVAVAAAVAVAVADSSCSSRDTETVEEVAAGEAAATVVGISIAGTVVSLRTHVWPQKLNMPCHTQTLLNHRCSSRCMRETSRKV